LDRIFTRASEILFFEYGSESLAAKATQRGAYGSGNVIDDKREGNRVGRYVAKQVSCRVTTLTKIILFSSSYAKKKEKML
jgi:hypothetical protein